MPPLHCLSPLFAPTAAPPPPLPPGACAHAGAAHHAEPGHHLPRRRPGRVHELRLAQGRLAGTPLQGWRCLGGCFCVNNRGLRTWPGMRVSAQGAQRWQPRCHLPPLLTIHPPPPPTTHRCRATPWAPARRPSTRRPPTRCWRTAHTAPPLPPPASSSCPRPSSCCRWVPRGLVGAHAWLSAWCAHCAEPRQLWHAAIKSDQQACTLASRVAHQACTPTLAFLPLTALIRPAHPLQLYTLSLTKHVVFRTDTRPDVRAAAMWRMLSLPVQRAVPLVYARMVPLHGLLERPQVRWGGRACRGVCAWLVVAWRSRGGQRNAAIVMPCFLQQCNTLVSTRPCYDASCAQNAMPVPDKLWLSAEKLQPEGVYLLEVGAGGLRGAEGRCPAWPRPPPRCPDVALHTPLHRRLQPADRTCPQPRFACECCPTRRTASRPSSSSARRLRRRRARRYLVSWAVSAHGRAAGLAACVEGHCRPGCCAATVLA